MTEPRPLARAEGGAWRPNVAILPFCRTRGDALREIRGALDAAGVDTPALDARVLTSAVLDLTVRDLLIDGRALLTDAERDALEQAVVRRVGREPVGRIVGAREFWGLSFKLSPATLEPRPDTETVVSCVLDHVRRARRAGDPLRILDLGTGTGCLLVSLLHELPAATGLGVDLSPEAAMTAKRNAVANGVGDRARFLVADWDAALAARFDIVVSNPPYIASPDIGGLDPEVREHDPPRALDGGEDGLEAYRAIAAQLPDLLGPQGFAALEVGAGQAHAVGSLLASAGLGEITVAADLSGRERVVAATGAAMGEAYDEPTLFR